MSHNIIQSNLILKFAVGFQIQRSLPEQLKIFICEKFLSTQTE
jgi:hypothetical protein